MTTARQIAVEVLARSRDHDGFAAELVDEQLSRADLTGPDRRFVTQLVFGVIRRRATLDALIKPFVKIPYHAVETRVWDLLQLGTYQLAFLTQIPRHAAVYETVGLADFVGSLRAKGFVNGVLRRIAELVTDDFTDTPSPSVIPFDDQPVAGRYRRLAQPILPEVAADPSGYLAAGFSWPKWLADRWLARFGLPECLRLGFWFNSPPPLWLRVNKLHADRENYRLQLAALMIDAEPGEQPQSLRVSGVGVRDLPGFEDGDFAIQDHSSMLVAPALNPQPGNRILDLCSAPGGKTTHLAELMDNRGRVTACDIDPDRLRTVETLAQRLKINCIETVLLATETGDCPPGPFDAALVDVPCSNTGVLGRRPEVRWRIRPSEFEYLIRLQTRLLFTAIDRVKPGGAIVYSTCSIEPDENEGVIRGVMRGIRGLALEAERYAIPGQPADGGYWARLRKPRS